MDRPCRKNPRLALWNYSQKGWYFITTCTKDHRCLFGSIAPHNCGAETSPLRPSAHGLLCRQALERAQENYPAVTVHAHVVMPNHVHLLVQITENASDATSPLSRFVGYMKSETSKAIHRAHPECKVWQRSYYDHVIRDENDCLRIWQYIDENPRKWSEDRFFAG